MAAANPNDIEPKFDAAQFRADLATLTQPQTLIVGSPGYFQAQVFLEKQIRALPNVELRVHHFPMMVPITESATLNIPDAPAQPIYPFWPAQVRVNATPADGITGRLVYCGEGRIDQIPPADVLGQIAVVESSAGALWQRVAAMGARAILVLGSDETTNWELRSHDLYIPINIPRFYIPPGTFAERLRQGQITATVTLHAAVNWKQISAANFFALVRPSNGNTSGARAMAITAQYDASGLVPDLARGAGQAVQAAAALQMLRDAAKNPPSRPMLFCFTSGDSIQFLGMRNMLLALAESPQTSRDALAAVRDRHERATHDLDRAVATASHLSDLRVRDDRELIDRITQIVDTDLALEQDQIFRLRLSESTLSESDRATEQKLTDRQVQLNRVKAAFTLNPRDLSKPELAVAASEAITRTEQRLRTLQSELDARESALTDRIDLYEWLAHALSLNAAPAPDQVNARLLELIVGLDISDHGVRIGPQFFGQFQRTSTITDVQDFGSWLLRADRAAAKGDTGAAWFNALRGTIDLEPFNQLRSGPSYLAASMPIPTELTTAWGVPGFSMVTLDDQRVRRDTPTDTPEHLNFDAIIPQAIAVNTMLRRAWQDPTFKGRDEYRRWRANLVGQVVSAAPGKPVPNLPRDGFLVAYNYAGTASATIQVATTPWPKIRVLPWTLGIRRDEINVCDAEGNYLIEGLPRLQSEEQLFATTVYRVEPNTGAITATTDLGRSANDVSIYSNIVNDTLPIRSVSFNCAEVALSGLYDPRFLQSLNEFTALDARRNAEPQRWSGFLNERMFAGFFEPGSEMSLLFRFGRVGNRLILLNMAGAPVPSPQYSGERVRVRGDSSTEKTPLTPTLSPEYEGEGAGISQANASGRPRGFSLRALNGLGPLSLVTAKDFWNLDDQRLTEYRRAGVSGALIDFMHAAAAKQISAAESDVSSNNGESFTRNADGAWANEARVYDAARDMARDVIRAAIFLLLLLVPFSFCMERLLIGTPNVYKQIAGIGGIFAIMTAALWSFHPAFKISSSPLIIILAFAIILMSIVVITVVYGKFETELKRIRSGRGNASGASLARASVLMSAVLLGIANMRKRKFRTMLTSLTIVLITFAVLCFTSSTKYLDTTTLPTGVATNGNFSVMLRQRGFRPLLPMTTEAMAAVTSAATSGAKPIERWWNTDASDPKDQIAIVATKGSAGSPSDVPRVAAVNALLGLSPGESSLSRVGEVIGTDKFARLEAGEKDIIYLPNAIADAIKAKEGDRVRVGGRLLQVAGVFHASDFDNQCTMLSGESLAPLRYSIGALDSGGKKLDDVTADSFDLDSGGEASSTYEHLPASQFAIVPASVSKQMPNATLRVIAIKADDEAGVKTISDELTKRYALTTYAGYEDGVRLVSAGNLASISGAGQVAIPLAIAGLIIFNTMMGSIAERRGEIHVYTSLGLAPVHVGALFVAEAMTYGLIGVVFGYVIGQGVGTVLLKLGWLGQTTLNYSGTSAMLTMGLILLIVLLSALVPARLASKIAAPSIDRSWKVPEPKEDEITATLPFTINKTAADGALAYLAEFFDAHKEGSIGKFSAGQVEFFTKEESHGIKSLVWLTPFDLGVRQQLTLAIHPGQFAEIYEVEVVLHRLSGDDRSWYRMNRTFLTELRKQFLQWRSLSPQRMLEYVAESKELFSPQMDTDAHR